MNIIAVIPARGGSKGVPRKNIRPLAGKPLLVHAIDTARGSRFAMDVVVTTDDAEIAAVARAAGGEVLMRDPTLAADQTLMPPVVRDVLQRLASQGRSYDILVLLQPTSPLRTPSHVDAAVALLLEGRGESVFSVTRVEDAHPARMYQVADGRLHSFLPELEKANRQDLPALYHRNGVVYALKVETFLRENTFFVPGSLPLETSREQSVNIDEPFDLLLAELLVAQKS